MLESILYTIVKDDIDRFNNDRGGRKELQPIFLRELESGVRYRKYGRIVDVEGTEDGFDAIQRVGHQVVPTLLERKPRPVEIRLDIAETINEPIKVLVRLTIPKRRR